MRFLEKEYLEMKKNKSPFCLVHFDLKNFVEINEQFSHDAGDFILKESIKVIKNYLRDFDSISRWGGVEFLILLPDIDLKNTVNLIDRINKILSQRTFIYDGCKIKVNSVFSVCQASLDKTIDEIIKDVDNLLYQAKNSDKQVIY